MVANARQWKNRLLRAAGIAGVGLVLVFGVMSCKKVPAQNGTQQSSVDPANGNFAPMNGQPAQVLAQSDVNESQQQAEDYAPGQQPPAPIERRSANGQELAAQAGYDQGVPAPDQGYDQGAPMDDQQAEAIYDADLTEEEATEPPPPLPDYDQPPCPDPNYLWTPGYWAWGPAGYYWVPGAWVAAPYVGALWTPGYWGFVGNVYRWHHGFWGSHIGFYGGVDYGFGYVGHGYYGGYWNNGRFFYNTSVNHVNAGVIHNVYAHRVVVNNRVSNGHIFNRVSYVGGRGGLQARPLPAEAAVMREQRIPPMQSQVALRQQAASNRAQFFAQNHGRPQTTVFTRPVAADRSLPAALPRTNAPAANSFRGGERQRPGGQAGAAALPNGRIEPQGRSAAPVQRGHAQPGTPRPNFAPQQGRQNQPGRPAYNNNQRPQTFTPQQGGQARPQAQPNGGRPEFQRPTRGQPEARPQQQAPQFQQRQQQRQQEAPQFQQQQARPPQQQHMAAPAQTRPEPQHGQGRPAQQSHGQPQRDDPAR